LQTTVEVDQIVAGVYKPLLYKRLRTNANEDTVMRICVMAAQPQHMPEA
jgi:hypothetical protein